MELFKIGKIVSIGKTYVILENNYTGYIVYVANPNQFIKDKVIKIYTYLHQSEYSSALYGFSSFKERILFEDLISVNGIGPKTAIAALKMGTDNVSHYIASGDAKSLSSIPQIGIKTANQLIFELRGKYEKFISKTTEKKYSTIDIVDSLKTLGFNQKQIDYALTNVTPNQSVEVMLEEAIKSISNAKFA